MKKKIIVFVGLSILLSAWLVLANAFHIQAGEAGRLKTVTLRVEGMT